MSLSQLLLKLQEKASHGNSELLSLFAGGMDTICPIVPRNVIVRLSSNELAFDTTSIHQRMILKVILKGKVLTCIDGITFPMEAGDAVLFFPFQFHSSRGAKKCADCKFLAVSFTEKDNNYTPLLPLKNKLLQITQQDEKRLWSVVAAFQKLDETTSSEAIGQLYDFLIYHLQDIGEFYPASGRQ